MCKGTKWRAQWRAGPAKFEENLLALWKEWQDEHPGGEEDARACEVHSSSDPFTQGLLDFIVQNLVMNRTYDALPPCQNPGQQQKQQRASSQKPAAQQPSSPAAQQAATATTTASVAIWAKLMWPRAKLSTSAALMQQAMAEDSIVSRASCPCPPWAYGVTVWPGPTWEFDGQNVVRGKVALGVTKVPDDDTLQEWSDYVIDAARSGYWSTEAGWAPTDRVGLDGAQRNPALARGPCTSTKAAMKEPTT